jgi:antitoxin component of MazEF toxin-antitoxin module
MKEEKVQVELSSVNKGNQANSLKTVIPQKVAQALKISSGDKLKWEINETKGEVKVTKLAL